MKLALVGDVHVPGAVWRRGWLDIVECGCGSERIEQNGETDSLRPIDRSKHTSPGVDEKKSEAIAIPADDEGRDQLARRNASPSPA